MMVRKKEGEHHLCLFFFRMPSLPLSLRAIPSVSALAEWSSKGNFGNTRAAARRVCDARRDVRHVDVGGGGGKWRCRGWAIASRNTQKRNGAMKSFWRWEGPDRMWVMFRLFGREKLMRRKRVMGVGV